MEFSDDDISSGTDGLWDNLDAETLDECVETAAPYLWKVLAIASVVGDALISGQCWEMRMLSGKP